MKIFKRYLFTIPVAGLLMLTMMSTRPVDLSTDHISTEFDFNLPSTGVEAIPLPGETGAPNSYNELITKLAEEADRFIGARYRLGATGPKAFDCSGFTSHLFKNIGVELNRTSKMQYTQGEKVERHELQPGDLMFFSSPRSGRGRVGHVGVVISADSMARSWTFVHASTSKGVTYQTFPDNGYFDRNYIGARRVM